MKTQIPTDALTSVDQYDALIVELTNEFDEVFDEASTADLAEIAEAISAAREQRATFIAERDAERAERDRLAEVVAGPPVEATPEPDPEPEPVAEVVEPEPVVEEPKVLVTASQAPTPKPAVSNTGNPPAAPAAAETAVSQVRVTAAADVPDVATGAALDRSQLARAFHSRARGLPDSSPRLKVAQVSRGFSDALRIDKGSDPMEAIENARAARDGVDANSLLASGGYAAPSETLFEQFSVESRSGLLDIPTVEVVRGGLQVPSYFGISDASAALWSWSESLDETGEQAASIAVASGTATATITGHGYGTGTTVRISGSGVALLDGDYQITVVDADEFTFTTSAADGTGINAVAQAIKPSLKVPAPTWTDYRLELEGLWLTHGNLMDRAYPEQTERFVDLTMTAHLHRLSNAMMSDISGFATAVTVATRSDAFGDVLNAIDLQVADYRSQHLMDEDVVLEAAVPMHLVNQVRATLAMRAGVNPMSVTRADIVAEFTNRNVRPQFLAGYEPLWNGTPRTSWPTSSKMTLWVSGAVVAGLGGTIDLGVVRDSALNATNDYTLAWSEELYVTMLLGPAPREVTFTTTVDGDTGGPKA